MDCIGFNIITLDSRNDTTTEVCATDSLIATPNNISTADLTTLSTTLETTGLPHKNNFGFFLCFVSKFCFVCVKIPVSKSYGCTWQELLSFANQKKRVGTFAISHAKFHNQRTHTHTHTHIRCYLQTGHITGESEIYNSLSASRTTYSQNYAAYGRIGDNLWMLGGDIIFDANNSLTSNTSNVRRRRLQIRNARFGITQLSLIKGSFVSGLLGNVSINNNNNGNNNNNNSNDNNGNDNDNQNKTNPNNVDVVTEKFRGQSTASVGLNLIIIGSAYFFDASNLNNVKILENPPLNVLNPCVVTDGIQFVYVIGGLLNVTNDNLIVSNILQVYDLIQETWINRILNFRSLNIPRYLPSCVFWKNQIIVFSGFDNNHTFYDSIEVYDPMLCFYLFSLFFFCFNFVF